MEYFVSFFQTTKNGNGIFYCRLINHDWLETTCKSSVFFNVLTILIQCGCTNTVQLTSGKHRFQHVACVHCTVCFAGADDQMKFIDEEDDFTLALFDFFKNCFQTFLKFATVFCACNKCAHIQCEDFLFFKAFRHITCNNSLCKTFDSCCFTNARFTDQYRVVLGLTGKDSDDVTDFCITADDWIQFLVSCFFDKILTIFI